MGQPRVPPAPAEISLRNLGTAPGGSGPPGDKSLLRLRRPVLVLLLCLGKALYLV